jgi:hypothetical protein
MEISPKRTAGSRALECTVNSLFRLITHLRLANEAGRAFPLPNPPYAPKLALIRSRFEGCPFRRRFGLAR